MERCRMCGASALVDAGEVDGYPFVRCGVCEFIFTPRMRTSADAPPYEAGADPDAPEVGWATADFVLPALAMLGDGGPCTILDFGTGQSWIPDMLRNRGHRVIGVDIMPPRSPHRDRLTGDLLDLHLEGGLFDLVLAFQVFEHLLYPRPILDELLRLTRPGGLVAIHTDMEVPDRSDTLAAWWYVMPPMHCSFYRHRTFEVYARATGHALVHKADTQVVIRRA